MRTVRVIGSILVIILAGLLGAFIATVYESRQASTNEPKSPSDSLQMDGWTPMTADPHWSMPPKVTVVGGSLNSNYGDPYLVVVDRITGTTPHAPIGGLTDTDPYATVGDEYTIGLTADEFSELDAKGYNCVMSSLLVLMPSTDRSNLDQLMNDCNSLSTVAMTVIISEVM